MGQTIVWRCLIVEDDAENARFIAEGFRSMGHIAVVSREGADALARATTEPWDLVVLDRMLPNEVDGLSILSTLRALGKKTPVLVLSALSALDERVRGLKAGGDDYLTKPFAFSELAARAEALVRRSRVGPEIRRLQVSDLELDLAKRQVERGGRPIALQPREFRLLAYLMMHAGQVLTRTMLLEAVWDYQFDPQTNVIDVQVSRLRAKLDVGGAPTLIHTVRGVGYRLASQHGGEALAATAPPG
ncbi:response regulator transcription factor [Variovorax saccharolyticus]|uniref:response regulator transcription factor n=1 Tax=Variovorax saccharolyticus TaxID=3053516 RepID=UPI00257721F3|nr:response regulator transcription factor [Variovorax sp. J31P216]MDM0026352.1 response regulator transcription factor [Variovorax sp. J31P216]